jgi:catechol 2,3-dioxygenase-like lactoylglutathione lyase family enzyme
MKNFSVNKRIHLGLKTEHFEESLNFYRTLFNAEPVKVRTGYAKFELEEPPVNFTLNAAKHGSGGNSLSHLGIQVKSREEVQKQQERLAGRGLKTTLEQDSTCCYALQDKVWVKDPDGNPWETFVFLEDRDEKQVKTACCQ